MADYGVMPWMNMLQTVTNGSSTVERVEISATIVLDLSFEGTNRFSCVGRQETSDPDLSRITACCGPMSLQIVLFNVFIGSRTIERVDISKTTFFSLYLDNETTQR